MEECVRAANKGDRGEEKADPSHRSQKPRAGSGWHRWGYPLPPPNCRRVRKLLKTKEWFFGFVTRERKNRRVEGKRAGVDFDEDLGGGALWRRGIDRRLMRRAPSTGRGWGDGTERGWELANTGENSTRGIKSSIVLQGMVEFRGWMVAGAGWTVAEGRGQTRKANARRG